MLPQKFPFNRHPYCVTFRLRFCCSSNTLLIRGNSLGSTKSTQLQATLTSHLDGNSLKNTADKIIILYSFEGDFWADYLWVGHTEILPQKFLFHRHPYYCNTFHFPFGSISKTILIRGNSLGITKSTQLKAALKGYLDGNSPYNTSDKTQYYIHLNGFF